MPAVAPIGNGILVKVGTTNGDGNTGADSLITTLWTKQYYFSALDATYTSYGLSYTDFNWGSGAPGGPSDGSKLGVNNCPIDSFGVIWDATLIVPTTGTYTFTGNGDDGVRVSIYDPGTATWTKLFSHNTNANPQTGSMALTAGVIYKYEQQFTENGGGANGNFRWTPPGGGSQVMPQTVFYYGYDAYGL